MKHPLNAQQLDGAWNAYIAAVEGRALAFVALIDLLLPTDNPGRAAYLDAAAGERAAAQAIRGAQADVLTVLSLRLSEVHELARGLQHEAGLVGRVAALESAVAALHLDVQQIRLGRRLTEGERE